MVKQYEFFKETIPAETKTLFDDVLFKAKCSFAEYLIIEVVRDAFNQPAMAEQSTKAINHHIKHLRDAEIKFQDLHPVVRELAQMVIRKKKLD